MDERQNSITEFWDETGHRAELVIQPSTFFSDGGEIRAWRGSNQSAEGSS